MNTDDLVTLLARGADAVDSGPATRRLVGALGGGVVVAIVFALTVLGAQTRLAEEASLPMFWVRGAFCAALGVAGVFAAWRSARPGYPLGWVWLGIVLPPVVMWALAADRLAQAGHEQWTALILGSTASVCPWLIALESVPIFAGLVWAMKAWAPTRLGLAGGACGLAAGGLGALAYTLHCPELAAPFLGVWYVLGILIPTLAGALFAPRWLRW
jgi:hypothetical protein